LELWVGFCDSAPVGLLSNFFYIFLKKKLKDAGKLLHSAHTNSSVLFEREWYNYYFALLKKTHLTWPPGSIVIALELTDHYYFDWGLFFKIFLVFKRY